MGCNAIQRDLTTRSDYLYGIRRVAEPIVLVVAGYLPNSTRVDEVKQIKCGHSHVRSHFAVGKHPVNIREHLIRERDMHGSAWPDHAHA